MAGKPRKDGKPRRSPAAKSRPKTDQSNWRKKLQQSRVKFDDPQKEIYLKALADHGMRGRAALAAGVCKETVRKHAENDPDFAEALDAALDAYRDKFVDHAVNLAYEGIEVKKYDKDGNLVEERRDYPIRLIELELKRVEPGYREKQQVDLNHTGGVMIAPADMSPEDWVAQQQAANEGRTDPPSSKPADG